MKKSVKKTVSIIAGAIFIFALTMNVVVTLDNPLELMSNTAMAQTSGGSSGDGGDCDTYCTPASGWSCIIKYSNGTETKCGSMRKKSDSSS